MRLQEVSLRSKCRSCRCGWRKQFDKSLLWASLGCLKSRVVEEWASGAVTMHTWQELALGTRVEIRERDTSLGAKTIQQTKPETASRGTIEEYSRSPLEPSAPAAHEQAEQEQPEISSSINSRGYNEPTLPSSARFSATCSNVLTVSACRGGRGISAAFFALAPVYQHSSASASIVQLTIFLVFTFGHPFCVFSAPLDIAL